MGIQSASSTFTRFFVPDPVTEDFWSFVADHLQAGDFKECVADEEQSTGFASWDDFFEPCSLQGAYHKGEYVAFQFRVDQRRIPPILVKQYVRQELQKYQSEHEGKWPSRQERQEIQEKVQNWLFSRMLPQPSACEIVWSPANKWMLFGSTSTRNIDAFLEHFEKHFHLYPVPLYHVQWALHHAPIDSRQKDVLSSMVSVRSQHAIEEGRFLGYEFLTWLWFFMEQPENLIKISDQKTAQVHLGGRLVMALPGQDRERVICTTQANALHEARTALRQGKMVEELQVFLNIGDNEYLFTLDSILWAVKGLKTPKQLPDSDKEDADGRFLEKMFFLEEVLSTLNALYGKFLSARLSPSWESDTLPIFKAWIEGGSESENAPTSGEGERDSAPF
jgi:DNA recombination-dependent growth factor C